VTTGAGKNQTGERIKQGKAPIDIKPLMAKKHDKILN
jgi:hypothetical protein